MAAPIRSLLDADDTLWENDIYFEDVIEEFHQLRRPRETIPAEFRGKVEPIEMCKIKKGRHDSECLSNNLAECSESRRKRPATTAWHGSETKTSYASSASTHEGEPFVRKAFRAECVVNGDHTANRTM